MNIVTQIEAMGYDQREFKLKDPDGYPLVIFSPIGEKAQEEVAGG